MKTPRALVGLFVLACSFAIAGSARAADEVRADGASRGDVRLALPQTAYAYALSPDAPGAIGAALVGDALVARDQRATLGGGATAWGSPVARLTLVGEAQRDLFGNFAPSAAAIVRLAGDPASGWSLGALGKFKVEGFGVGPSHEIESEIEAGAIVAFTRAGWHVDANAIAGKGTGDDGEVDAEARLRLGRDLGPVVRVGVDGQARARLAGTTPLLGGRTWDFAGGPQIVVGGGPLFLAVTSGPSTMGVSNGVGFTALTSVGGTI